MSSIKCHNCGLVNFATLEHCKRCRAALDQSQAHQTTDQSQAHQTTGQQPVGAWRDRWWLVKHLGVSLDESCIKCSESAEVSYKPVSVKAYSAWSLLTQLAGVRVFRWINFEVPLCRRHRHGMDRFAVGSMVTGALICMLGVGGMRMNSIILPLVLFILGFFVAAVGLIFQLVRRETVQVWKYKHPYIWLWGAKRRYLKQLPNWSDRKA